MRQIESLFQTADTLVPPRPMTELCEDTEAEILWGDMGIANFFISREDLK